MHIAPLPGPQGLYTVSVWPRALLGSVIGAAAALLLSPWRGAEARLKLKERAQDVSSKVGEKAKEMAVKAKEMLPQKGEDED